MMRIVSLILASLIATQSAADSCWDHNGSVMRLTADGDARWFWYETTPHGWQWPAGVRPGTLLFDGWKNGEWYSGTARRFSSACPGSPLDYQVEGPVLQNPLRVQLTGSYEVQHNCQPTGSWANDTLVFTYMSNC